MQAQSIPRLWSSLPAPLRTVALAAGGVLFGLVCARVAVSHYGKAAIVLLVGAPLLIAIARRPFLAALCVLVALSSLFAYDTLPRIPLPGTPPVTIGDVLVVAAVCGTVWRKPWRNWPAPARRFTLALLAVVLFSSYSSIRISLESAQQAHSAVVGLRILLFMAFALTIGLELSGSQWRRLLDVCIGFSAVISIISIAAFLSPALKHSLIGLAPTSVTSAAQSFVVGGGSAIGATGARIRLPGLYFVYAMSIPTFVLALALKDRWRPWRFAAFLLMVAAIGLSLNRNMYVGALVGLLVAALFGGRVVRHRLSIAAVTVLLTVLLAVLSSFGTAASAQVAVRASTVLSPSTVLTSNSIQGRAFEFSNAISSIGRHPLDGIGWFQYYYVGRESLYGVENLYLHLATDYGIPAALAWLFMPGVLLLFGMRSARAARAPLDRAIVAALMGSLVALLLSLLVGSYLQEPTSAIGFAAACGLLLAAGLHATSAQGASAPGGDPVDPAAAAG
jgi:hypothetical protein